MTSLWVILGLLQNSLLSVVQPPSQPHITGQSWWSISNSWKKSPKESSMLRLYERIINDLSIIIKIWPYLKNKNMIKTVKIKIDQKFTARLANEIDIHFSKWLIMTSSIKSDIRFELIVPVLVYRPNFGPIEKMDLPEIRHYRSQILKKKSGVTRAIQFSICQYAVSWGFQIRESRKHQIAPKKTT
jgi:hypothetical protein